MKLLPGAKDDLHSSERMSSLLRFSKIHREYPIKRLTSINREGDELILPIGKTKGDTLYNEERPCPVLGF